MDTNLGSFQQKHILMLVQIGQNQHVDEYKKQSKFMFFLFYLHFFIITIRAHLSAW